MNNSMNILKRMMAFLLAMLLLTTMMGDDFSSLADSDVDIVTETITDDGAASDVETTEGETADTTTPEPEVTEEVTEPVVEEPEVAESEVTDPEVTEDVTNPEEINIDDSQNINETEEIVPEEEVPEEDAEEECEHDWKAVSNDDGTHTWVCTKCEEKGETEDCEFGEDGICVHCGYEQPAEEEECDHEWEYTSNDDGTHTKRCAKCGVEEVEDCQFDEDWVCELCGYEDMTLEYQEYSKTIHGVKVTVAGEMPRKSKVTIYTKSLTRVNDIVNETIDEGTFEAYEAFDITIYDRRGDKYQPKDDGNSVSVTFEGVSELADTPDEEIVAYRIEDDQETVTEIPTDVAGEDVSFDAEHFSTYVVGTISDVSYIELEDWQNFAAVTTATSDTTYTKPLKATFVIYVSDASETYSFTATAYKNLSSTSLPTSGTKVATGSQDLTPDGTGYYTIEIDLTESVSGNSYVTKGNSYAIVVSSSTAVNLCYGSTYENSLSSQTYIKGNSSTSWNCSGTYNDAFYLSTSANSDLGCQASLELTDTISDSYEVASITTTSTPDNDDVYHYAVGNTDTLTAVLSDSSIERSITWTSSDTSIATVTSKGTMTATLKAVSAGTVTITATYNGNSKEITVNVVDVYIGGVSTLEGASAYSTSYTGSAITPSVVLYSASGTSVGTTSAAYPYMTSSCSNNKNAGTATVVVKYYPTVDAAYTYTRTFTINPIDITTTSSTDGNNAFAAANYKVTSGSVTSVTNVNSNSALAVTPVFNTDFTATVSNLTGVTSSIVINADDSSCSGNFTGTVTVSSSDTDISNALTVSLSSNSRLLDCYYTGTAYTLTEVTDAGWSEVTFYNSNNAEVTGVVTASSATYAIYDYVSGYSATDYAAKGAAVSATTAGKKAIVFTMNSDSGYTGSIFTTFTIQQASMTDVTIVWPNGNEFAHTGSAIEPVAGTDFVAYLGYESATSTGVEVSTSDYNVTYQGDHINTSDSPRVKITGAGTNFDSSTYNTSAYYIVPNYELDLVVRISDSGTYYDGTYSNSYVTGYSKYYDGSTSIPTISVRLNGALTYGTDYTYTVYDSYDSTAGTGTTLTEKVGTKYIVVTGLNNGTTDYSIYDPVVATYKVESRPLNNSAITVSFGTNASEKTFTGAALTWSTATDASTAKVATALSNGVPTTWSTTTTTNADLTIKYGSTYLIEGTDFEINYGDDYINVGTVSPTITGLGNYTGTLSGTYTYSITAASLSDGGTATAALAATEAFAYTGSAHTPSVKVTIGSTFTETFKYDSTTQSLTSTNFTVAYTDNISPGTATITVTGKNNLTGSAVITFTISSNKDAYSAIYIGGTNAAEYVSVEEETDSSGNVTGYTRYYKCSSLVTYYTGSNYSGSVAVYGSDGTLLTRNTDYAASYKNAKAANTSTDYTSSSPYLKITGLDSYAGNNAIVYFNIQPREITEDMVSGIDSSYDWSSTSTVKPSPVVTYKSALTVSTDYTVEYYDSYDSSTDTGTDITTVAGTKYLVIKGTGNYTGTVVVTYDVGTDLSQALVTISSYYYTATTNEERWITQETNNSTLDDPFDIYWRNSKAPTVSLATAAGTTIDSTNYTVADPVSSLSLTGDNLYDARPANSTTDSYNIITYKATGKPTAGYFGAATIYYRINPQSIETTDARMTTAGSSTAYYTGSDITVEPSFIFTYKYEIAGTKKTAAQDGYSLELTVGTDVEVDTNIGSKVGDNVTKTATGMGNYTGTQTLGYTIQAGYVTVSRTYNSEKEVIATTSKPTDESATTPYTYEYDLSDSTQEYYAEYYYTGSDVLPDISITATNGTTALTKGTDYTITYPTDAVTVGEKEIVINIIGSNYVAQTITIKYKILSNSIEDFVGTVNDVTYTAQTLTISSIKASSLTLKNKAGVELTRGTDYALVTDTSELDAINDQFNSSYTSLIVTTSLPSYQTNYVFVKGLGTYSGYCMVPFNVVLDLSANGMSHVYFADEKPSLANESSIVPVITYKTLGSPNASTYDETLDSSFTYNGNTYNNYTITRGNAGNPGPDTNITVTGQYMCTGSATNVTDADGDTICFLADLSTLANDGTIALSATTFDYTGSSINVLQYLSGIDSNAVKGDVGTGSSQEATGDYVVTYAYKEHAADTSTTTVTTVKEAGFYYLVISGTSESDYFISTSSTGTKLSFYVKYNLSSDDTVITFYNPNDGTKAITSISYTGSEYSIAQNTKVTAAGESIYDYGSSITSYVTLTPTSVTKIGSYTVKATAKDTELVYGSKSATFKVTSVGLDTATFTLYNPYDSSVLYSTDPCTYNGGEIEPIVKASITVSGTTKTLTEGTDFTVKYYDNDKAGTGYFQIIGIGSYECDEFAPSNNTFTIEQLDLSSSYVKLEIDDATYAGYYNDPSTVADGLVKLTPSYSVYYVDTTNNIKNKLQEQTDSLTGDYKVYAWSNNTKAAKSTDTTAPPTLTITAGDSGNIKTGTQKSGTFTINQLNLSGNEVEIAQQTAEFTGSAINVADVVKIKSGQTYTSTTTGKTNQPVYLTQKGAYSSLDADSLYDYEISVKKDGTTYGTTITEQGTYTITLTGKNSCTGSLETYFTITGRSLEDNFHYYYDDGTTTGWKGTWTYDSTNTRFKAVGSDSSGAAECLTIYVSDVTSVGTTTENVPNVVIYDSGRTSTDTSSTDGYRLDSDDFTVTAYNNSAAATAEWSKTYTTDSNGGLHATVTEDSPYIVITGQGDYTGSITLPFNIGKNLNTVDLEITYTFGTTELDYDSAYDNPTTYAARHQYTYNGVAQKPTVKVYLLNGTTRTKLVQDTSFTVSYTDADGDEDSSINAGYKNIVITGMGDYCGTKSQMYSINRKQITADAYTFTNENPLQTTGGELTFTVSSGLSRIKNATDAYTYLQTAGVSETDAANYVNYFYAVYDGEAIVPTVTVKDNTLGTSGTTSKQISSDDLIFKATNSDTVSTFTYSGSELNATLSDYAIGFAASSATDFSTSGNYYATGSDNYLFHIKYIIVHGDIDEDSGFTVEFVNGLDGDAYQYDAGNEIKPEVAVKNSSRYLTEGTDYEVAYTNNIEPGVASVTVTGINNYSGTQSLNFYIWGDLSETKPYYYDSDGDFVAGTPVQQYSGTNITTGSPAIYLVLPAQNDQEEDFVLTYGTQYTATDYDSDDGYLTDGWVEYTGLGSAYWTGTLKLDYSVEYDEESVTATNYESSYEYTGYPIEPDFKLSISTATLGTITYSRSGVETTDLTSLGTITASIPYTVGSHEGTVEATYKITSRPIADCTIVLSREYPRYTGRAVEPPFTIYIESTNLQTGDTQIYRDLTEYDETTSTGDYSVDYGNYVYGDGKITFTGTSDEITGTVDKEYTIKLQNVANLTVTDVTSDTITVEWVRDIFSSGTKLKLYKMNSDGEYAIARETAVEGKTSTYTFENLSSSTNYKIEAIAYAVNGSTVLESDAESTTAVTGIAVTDITVASNAAGKATVSWSTSGNVIIYYIYRADDSTSDGKLVAIIPATTGSYTNTKLTSGQEYYYYIKGWAVVNGTLTQVTESDHVPVTIK